MPMSQAFKDRLFPLLMEIVEFFGTPFHIYDEAGIRQTGHNLVEAFLGVRGFREYFAVKALPNPRILELMKAMGFGFDCSSIPELLLSRQAGGLGEDIMFTSNNTSEEEFRTALADGGCILNLDDVSLIPKVPEMPELICFRYNPGPRRHGSAIIGNPVEAKYGIAHKQLPDAYRAAQISGARRFGLHTMLISNTLNYHYMVQTVKMLLDLTKWIEAETGIRFEFVNMGGGLGIPYRPEEEPVDVFAMGRAIRDLLDSYYATHGYVPHLYMESGRYMTGPHGTLVTKAINHKDTYRRFIGVDACMSALMRPGMYGAYHHIDVVGKDTAELLETVDVVGALCENNDKFAIQRSLPRIEDGDTLVIHDTGGHGHAMGFTYNGRLRPKELLLRADGSVELIRRQETVDDYFATLSFEPAIVTFQDKPG